MNEAVTAAHDDWLAVSTEGFAAMNAGRPPAHLVKELVQNSLDAIGDQPGRIELTIAPEGSGGILVSCRDDGCGVADLKHIRTVFHTSKTDSHLQRGRMGRGFKELLCLASHAAVVSGPRKLSFLVESGRRVTREEPAKDPIAGTLVTMHMPWPPTVIDELAGYFRGLLPPSNVKLVVNGAVIPRREAAHRVEASLTTELFENGRWVRPPRKTVIELIPTLPRGSQDSCGPGFAGAPGIPGTPGTPGEVPHLYEMGIPICPVEWTPGFHANVLQRVPMNPCRDAVASGYLVKVHRACLPALLPGMNAEQVLEDWVGQAASQSASEVQKDVIRRGFGENLARSVPAMGVRQFDEDAREIGLKVVDTRQTSGGFREILQEHVPTTRQAVDRHNRAVAAAAGSGFGVDDAYRGHEQTHVARRHLIESAGGRERVQQVMEFARWYCQRLLDGYEDMSVCSVRLALLKPVNAIATWSGDDVLTLGLDTPAIWREPTGEESLSVLIHEAAHHLNAHHGRDFHAEVERLAGRAARVMLTEGTTVRGRWAALLEPPHI